MGKIKCECGYIHSNTCGFDGELYKYEQSEMDDPLLVFECCRCGNIMIDDPSDDRFMITYKPTEGKYNKILHDRKDYDKEF